MQVDYGGKGAAPMLPSSERIDPRAALRTAVFCQCLGSPARVAQTLKKYSKKPFVPWLSRTNGSASALRLQSNSVQVEYKTACAQAELCLRCAESVGYHTSLYKHADFAKVARARASICSWHSAALFAAVQLHWAMVPNACYLLTQVNSGQVTGGIQ